VECAVLIGPEYNANNGLVYDLLQSLTIKGPAWTWINMFQATRDGQNAWKLLLNYYEGDSAKTRGKQECYDSILKAIYQGNRRNFTFNNYVTIHQQAHQDLARLGEPVPENKKVRDFLNGITDPQCSNIKLNVLSNMVFMNDFAQTVNYIASAIDMTAQNTSTTARQISEYTRNQNHNGNTRGVFRGGRGRGRGRGRGGRGRGHGRHGNRDDASLGSRNYTPQEWQNLTAAEQREVYRQRDRLATARTIAAAITESLSNATNNNQDDVSAITNPSASAPPDNTPTRTMAPVNINNVSQALTRRPTQANRTTGA